MGYKDSLQWKEKKRREDINMYEYNFIIAV